MKDQWQYQVRIFLENNLAEVARRNPEDPAIAPLAGVLAKHHATMKCQFDAFTNYVAEAEKHDPEAYPLYEWTKATIEDPAKKAKYIKSFTIYVDDNEVYEKDAADAVEAGLTAAGRRLDYPHFEAQHQSGGKPSTAELPPERRLSPFVLSKKVQFLTQCKGPGSATLRTHSSGGSPFAGDPNIALPSAHEPGHRLLLQVPPQIVNYLPADHSELAMFRVTPKVISVLDYSKGFGHTDLVFV